MKVTSEFVNRHRTKKGGFTREQLSALGVSWPPKKGWLQNIIGKELTNEQEKLFTTQPIQKKDKRVKSSSLPWFITSRVPAIKRNGLNDFEQACLALEADGMPCPMHVSPEQWVKTNFSYICRKYQEAYPVQPSSTAKKQNKAAASLSRQIRHADRSKPSPKKVLSSGVDVTSAAFLSTYEWRKIRMVALTKYGPKCMCCGATPAQGAVMNVDHIKPRKLWPSLALDVNNLQILCHDCNHGKGNWDQTDWRE